MLRDYRAWLQSELQLLSNASHHAYAFGQANMAKRALERYDVETAERTIVELSRDESDELASALEMLATTESAPEPVVALLRRLRD